MSHHRTQAKGDVGPRSSEEKHERYMDASEELGANTSAKQKGICDVQILDLTGGRLSHSKFDLFFEDASYGVSAAV